MTAKSDDGVYFHMREVRRLGFAEKGIHEIALLVKHFCVDNKIGRSSCRIRTLTGCSEKISDSGPALPPSHAHIGAQFVHEMGERGKGDVDRIGVQDRGSSLSPQAGDAQGHDHTVIARSVDIRSA